MKNQSTGWLQVCMFKHVFYQRLNSLQIIQNRRYLESQFIVWPRLSSFVLISEANNLFSSIFGEFVHLDVENFVFKQF